MRRSVADVFAQLRTEGLATEASLEPAGAALWEDLQEDTPWYVKAAVGLGAWLATGFLFGFLMSVARLDDPAARLIAGAAIALTSVIAHGRSSGDFMRQSTVAASLAGQGLLVVGFHDLLDSPRLTAGLVAAISAAVLWFVPDRVHRFLSTVAFAVAMYVVVVDEQTLWGFEAATLLLVVLAALAWRVRPGASSNEVEEMLVPVGHALVVVLFAALLLGTATQFGKLSLDDNPVMVVGRLTTIGITLALVILIASIQLEQRRSLTAGPCLAALAGVVALGLITMKTPGIAAGASVLALAFDRRNRVLLGMGVIFLLVFGAVYYYSLHLSLLEKSGVLAGSGLLLLAIRQGIARA